MNANHGGDFQFRLCKVDDSLATDPEMSCFDDNILKFKNGDIWKPTTKPDARSVARFEWGSQETLVGFISINLF